MNTFKVKRDLIVAWAEQQLEDNAGILKDRSIYFFGEQLFLPTEGRWGGHDKTDMKLFATVQSDGSVVFEPGSFGWLGASIKTILRGLK